jgi:hypothetical protein
VQPVMPRRIAGNVRVPLTTVRYARIDAQHVYTYNHSQHSLVHYLLIRTHVLFLFAPSEQPYVPALHCVDAPVGAVAHTPSLSLALSLSLTHPHTLSRVLLNIDSSSNTAACATHCADAPFGAVALSLSHTHTHTLTHATPTIVSASNTIQFSRMCLALCGRALRCRHRADRRRAFHNNTDDRRFIVIMTQR